MEESQEATQHTSESPTVRVGKANILPPCSLGKMELMPAALRPSIGNSVVMSSAFRSRNITGILRTGKPPLNPNHRRTSLMPLHHEPLPERSPLPFRLTPQRTASFETAAIPSATLHHSGTLMPGLTSWLPNRVETFKLGSL